MHTDVDIADPPHSSGNSEEPKHHNHTLLLRHSASTTLNDSFTTHTWKSGESQYDRTFLMPLYRFGETAECPQWMDGRNNQTIVPAGPDDAMGPLFMGGRTQQPTQDMARHGQS